MMPTLTALYAASVPSPALQGQLVQSKHPLVLIRKARQYEVEPQPLVEREKEEVGRTGLLFELGYSSSDWHEQGY